MNPFLQKLAEQRRKFLEGLDANEGDINLDIFEDFYPDQAHFVYELLQNAEDASATEVTFTLNSDGCSCEHDGSRTFTEADVRSITGIHNSTKSKSPDQIGKFGVGFKSVFVYTLSPTVRSGEFSFKISRLVLPEPIERNPALKNRTRFEFPFNNPRKTPANAYAEIAAGLNELAETTLLFLSSLESIRWQIGANISGEVLRIQHSENHFEVLKQSGGRTTVSSHFLKFDQAVEGLDKQRVAVAFALDFLPNVQQFDQKMPLAKQLKIIPAKPGKVAVFFPAQKEASNLRFHLHAPFVPELSRASIKETPANSPLFQQLAKLTANSLDRIRSLGLLTTEFLAVIPNPHDQLPSRYEPIRLAIVHEMNTRPLTPTYNRSHAPAKRLLQAKSALKEILSDDDIELLVDWDDEPPLWAMAAAQRNSDADRFLESLAITKWDNEEFIKLIIDKTAEGAHHISTSPYFVNGPDNEFMAWLSNKPVDWHQKLYSHIYSELSPSGGCRRLRGLKIVRLDTGKYSVGTKCFFPSEGGEQNDVLLRVATDVYTSGKSKAEQESAKKLLIEIGVRDVGEAEQVEAILKQRYTRPAEVPDEKTYQKDLKRFVSLVEKEPDKAKLFSEYFIFECKGDQWCPPPGVFLDNPFMETGLAAYYDSLGTEASCFALIERYLDCDLAVKSLVKFAQSVGVQTHLIVQRKSVAGHPSERQLKTDWYSASVRRTSSEVNEDWYIPNLSELFECPTIALSKLIWNTVRVADARVVTARYRPNQQYTSRIAPSSLVLALQQNAWIPQGEGSFVRPPEASRDLLPEGFAFDPGWPWLKAISFGQDVVKKSEEERQRQAIAKEFGFSDSESLERAKRFAALPREEQERILSERENNVTAELPDNEPGNAARRSARIIAQAALAPERQTEVRDRSVSIGREEVKEDAAQYLRQQYTNSDGQMICQVCKGPLPFKLDDGSDYFEKVEFLKDMRKRHYQNYLALCPNHAAMFQHANGSEELIREMFSELAGNELEVVLAQQDATIYFTKTHIADLRSLLEAENISVARDCAGP